MKIEVNESKCIGCGICEEVCPVGAIVMDLKAHINPDECILCGACVGECPEQALLIGGMEDRPTTPEPIDYSGTMEGYGRGGGRHDKGRKEKGKGGIWSWLK